MGLADLGYLTDRRGAPCPKPKTRLEVVIAERPLTKIDEQEFRNQVWARDNYRCQCCRRAVIRTIERIPERGEVHHIHGRTGDLRFESRAAVLLCAYPCHERVTRHQIAIVATKQFTMRGVVYTDARFPLVFKETRG